MRRFFSVTVVFVLMTSNDCAAGGAARLWRIPVWGGCQPTKVSLTCFNVNLFHLCISPNIYVLIM